MIIAFEGVDGAGKNTLVTALEKELIAREIPTARLSFPRYEHSVHAKLAQQALYREMGDLIDSIHGMATLFALDRAEVASDLADLDEDGYVVLLDRYVASNAAYSLARAVERDGGQVRDVESMIPDHDVLRWVEEMEFVSLGSPYPELQVLVDVDAEVADSRAQHREATDESRARDAYETDVTLQELTVAAYRGLAQNQWNGPWVTVASTEGEVQPRAEELAKEIEAAYATQIAEEDVQQ